MDKSDREGCGERQSNAQLNREQLIRFLRRSLCASQRFERELSQAVNLLTRCTVRMTEERSELTRRMVELYHELDDQDRELDEVYGLPPDPR